MLSTSISYQGKFNKDFLKDLPYLRKKGKYNYDIFMRSLDKSIGKIEISETIIVIHYSGELMLAEYIIIHDIIMQLSTSVIGEIDDSMSFLGYLPSGESAYIITNWDRWLKHIYRSMDHCKNKVSYDL